MSEKKKGHKTDVKMTYVDAGKTAILVDGGFYNKRADVIYGKQSPEERIRALIDQCYRHQTHKGIEYNLYRIFYYDCAPIDKKVRHPLTGKEIDYKKGEQYKWGMEFLDLMRKQRKVALRLGKLSGHGSDFVIPSHTVKELYSGKLKFEDLKPNHLKLDVKQKGVDMRIGLDISSLAYKNQIDRIVLIAGDSDFVPAAKLARREGVDFILDPMWNNVSQDLHEHIDGLFSKCDKPEKLIKKEEKRKKKKKEKK